MNKVLVSLASRLFPRWVVNRAYDQLTNPQIRKLREHEEEVLDQAQKSRLSFRGFDIQLYQWGQGPRKVLLVHGWEGQAGNFADVILELLKRDFLVYAFDAPSHGYSSRGPASLFLFGDLVGELMEAYQVDQVISHSFGGVATTYALSQRPDFTLSHYLLFTVPDRFMDYAEDTARRFGMTESVKDQLLERVRKETGADPYSLAVSNFVQDVAVNQVLILHDEADRVIPFEKARTVAEAWPQARIEGVQDTGHFRILRTQSVIERGLDFLG